MFTASRLPLFLACLQTLSLSIPLSHLRRALRASAMQETENNSGTADSAAVEEGKGKQRWRFSPNEVLKIGATRSIRAVLDQIIANIQEDGPRPVVTLGSGDPSMFECFGTDPAAVEAIVSAVRSGKFNCYGPTVGLLSARRSIAEYLSHDLPYELSPDDVFLTSGCSQAIEVVLSVLARPGANILLPRPGFPFYEARAAFSGIEARHFNLLPERGWEVDLDAVEKLTDDNTVAMVIINPGNPCGSVYTSLHLMKIAETASKLGILVIADEVYDHLTYGSNPFVPMGTFGKTVPVLTLGSISKRWIVPGWRLGWIVTTDPNSVLQETKIVDSIVNLLNVTTDPATFVQAAVSDIIKNTKDEFFKKKIDILRQTTDECYNAIKEIDSLTCSHKPEGSMFAMAKLNLSLLEDIDDDFDFCSKLAKEESVIIVPGRVIGLENWLRLTFAIDPLLLKEGLSRLKSFCQRHAKKKNVNAA